MYDGSKDYIIHRKHFTDVIFVVPDQSTITENIKDLVNFYHIPSAAKQRDVIILWLACSWLVFIQANVSFNICPICWCVYVCYICTTRV